ncbi:type VI protein secretion system component VasF [Actinoplanes octamycinicus]|uniref:Type VI protein secretion system component VasF n=1 Tax=Actinoplanes octamycinicus TaxID=135948 RepID=A0A7W7H2F7_9ACTN|nr:hypothetical protein [Actinoplanes octamycinicus]MBB4742766.1 type VI protein secretion system component VasF [Actinoplanes octamycinicus]GIE58379.1 hypothetical protein Aoc01nite_37810 [Actinoplanes octamycinicus]
MAGRVRVRPVAGRVRPIERALTELARLDEPPPPVFADPGGRRRRRLRLWSSTAGMLVLVLVLAFWLSQLVSR